MTYADLRYRILTGLGSPHSATRALTPYTAYSIAIDMTSRVYVAPASSYRTLVCVRRGERFHTTYLFQFPYDTRISYVVSTGPLRGHIPGRERSRLRQLSPIPLFIIIVNPNTRYRMIL